MNISSIGRQTGSYISPQNQSGNTVDSLQRQREILEKQLEEVKSRPQKSQAEQDAAVAKKRDLEKQIAVIDQKIQKLSQNKDGETSETSSSTMQKVSSLNSASAHESSERNLSVSASKNQSYLDFQRTGYLLDTYA